MKCELTSKRLLEAMQEAGITQRELSERAGIKEPSVSQYTNGAHSPSNINAKKMAAVLHVNPVWLMGFDVPKCVREERIDTDLLNNEQFQKLKSYFEYLLKEQQK